MTDLKVLQDAHFFLAQCRSYYMGDRSFGGMAVRGTEAEQWGDGCGFDSDSRRILRDLEEIIKRLEREDEAEDFANSVWAETNADRVEANGWEDYKVDPDALTPEEQALSDAALTVLDFIANEDGTANMSVLADVLGLPENMVLIAQKIGDPMTLDAIEKAGEDYDVVSHTYVQADGTISTAVYTKGLRVRQIVG